MGYLQQLADRESFVVDYFRNRVLPSFQRFDTAEFEDVLLQKRALSAHFKAMYLVVIRTIGRGSIVKIAGEILRDEYIPQDHTLLLDNDLRRMGFSNERLVGTVASPQTLEVIAGAYMEAARSNVLSVHQAVFLRTFAELLSGIEYMGIVPELERRYGLTAKDSEFYFPHMLHDRSAGVLSTTATTHTDGFNAVLADLLTSPHRLTTAQVSMQEALRLRENFWKQFSRSK